MENWSETWTQERKPDLAKGPYVMCTGWKWNHIMWLLLLLSHFSRVRLCATPQTEAHQAPPSLGFSMQEHWSGLTFPSPMQESEKLKVKSLSHVQLLVTPWTAAHQAPPSMGFSRQEYWNKVPLPSLTLCGTCGNSGTLAYTWKSLWNKNHSKHFHFSQRAKANRVLSREQHRDDSTNGHHQIVILK